MSMDRKNLYAPSAAIPDLRTGPRTQRVKVDPPQPKSLVEKLAISITSGIIMAICVSLSQRLFGQMWIGVVLGTLLSTKFLHSRFERPERPKVDATVASDEGDAGQEDGQLTMGTGCLGPAGDPRVRSQPQAPKQNQTAAGGDEQPTAPFYDSMLSDNLRNRRQ